jgi:hypothetical protein
VAWAVEAHKVWDFLGQIEMTLVPFSFGPIRSGELAREVSNVLPTLESTGAKMLRLEEVVVDQLEAEGRILAEKVAEHVLTCFRSRDPIISLDPGALWPIVETEEAARVVSRRPPRQWLHGSSAYRKTHGTPILVLVSARTSAACI